MKEFTTAEIRYLLNQVYREEISFPEMVEIMNERVSEAEDIPEELKEGDLAIFWDSDKESAMMGKYDYLIRNVPFPHKDKRGNVWANAIKFESNEQYEKLLKGEI